MAKSISGTILDPLFSTFDLLSSIHSLLSYPGVLASWRLGVHPSSRWTPAGLGTKLTRMLHKVLATIDGRREASLSALKDFLAIPSVSTKPEHKPDLQRCATWLADQLKVGGMRAQIHPTAGHPI